MDRVAETELSQGHPDGSVAVKCGIASSTMYEWYRLGLSGDARYETFAWAIETGRHAFEERMLGRVEAGGVGWQSAAWLLERTRPTRYARTDRQDPEARKEDFKMVVTVEYVTTVLPAHNAESRVLPERTGPTDDDDSPVPSDEHVATPMPRPTSQAVRVTAEATRSRQRSLADDGEAIGPNTLRPTLRATSLADGEVEASTPTTGLSVPAPIEGTYRVMSSEHVRFPSSRVNRTPS